MWLDREGAGRGLHEPAATHAAHFACERLAACRRDVLDHARAVHEVELVLGEGQACRCVGLHEWARIIGALGHVHARDVELGLQRAQAERAAADIEHPCAWVEPAQRKEALVAPPPRAGGQGGGELCQRAAGGPVDVVR